MRDRAAGDADPGKAPNRLYSWGTVRRSTLEKCAPRPDDGAHIFMAAGLERQKSAMEAGTQDEGTRRLVSAAGYFRYNMRRDQGKDARRKETITVRFPAGSLPVIFPHRRRLMAQRIKKIAPDCVTEDSQSRAIFHS